MEPCHGSSSSESRGCISWIILPWLVSHRFCSFVPTSGRRCSFSPSASSCRGFRRAVRSSVVVAAFRGIRVRYHHYRHGHHPRLCLCRRPPLSRRRPGRSAGGRGGSIPGGGTTALTLSPPLPLRSPLRGDGTGGGASGGAAAGCPCCTTRRSS